MGESKLVVCVPDDGTQIFLYRGGKLIFKERRPHRSKVRKLDPAEYFVNWLDEESLFGLFMELPTKAKLLAWEDFKRGNKRYVKFFIENYNGGK